MSIAVGTGGLPTYLPPGGLSTSPYASLMGRPVIPVEYAATIGDQGDIMLADMSQYVGIDKGGTQTASSIHVNFVYDETVFRFVYRFDGQPSWNSALTPYKGTNTLSPFVVLDERA
jgi:HK97 family phage major capsid protein